jgi:hypothetical protein
LVAPELGFAEEELDGLEIAVANGDDEGRSLAVVRDVGIGATLD